MLDGNDFPGYKLVEGQSKRSWTDKAEDRIVKEIGEEKAYNKKLIGLGDAEKLIDKKIIDEITQKPKGKATLAPISDKRKAISLEKTED